MVHVQTLKDETTNIGTFKVGNQNTSFTSMISQNANATNVSLSAIPVLSRIALDLSTTAVQKVLGALVVLPCSSAKARSLSGTRQGTGAMLDLVAVRPPVQTLMVLGQ
mmetsp:Transcript_80465/g.151974  ORF Transcript_80465/g.151974 Transcript_80465/m.151974 type:complete len:108 (-) Transcript_80465:760-1083(-)